MALGALVALGCGLRASEVRQRRVRDLDDGGRVLWITSGKTRNAQRNPMIPSFLRPYLVEASAGLAPNAYLFGHNESRPDEPKPRQAVNVAVARICTHAGVPQVCPHSLRGLWATLAVESGAATEAVASALGHGSFAMTARHYAQPGAVQSAKTARVMDVLGLGDAGAELADLHGSASPAKPDERGTLAAELAQLDTATLRRLLQLATAANRSPTVPKRPQASRSRRESRKLPHRVDCPRQLRTRRIRRCGLPRIVSGSKRESGVSARDIVAHAPCRDCGAPFGSAPPSRCSGRARSSIFTCASARSAPCRARRARGDAARRGPGADRG